MLTPWGRIDGSEVGDYDEYVRLSKGKAQRRLA
jgi:hypothetical protein